MSFNYISDNSYNNDKTIHGFDEMKKKMDEYIGLDFDENINNILNDFPNRKIYKCDLYEFNAEQYLKNAIRILVDETNKIRKWQNC